MAKWDRNEAFLVTCSSALGSKLRIDPKLPELVGENHISKRAYINILHMENQLGLNSSTCTVEKRCSY